MGKSPWCMETPRQVSRVPALRLPGARPPGTAIVSLVYRSSFSRDRVVALTRLRLCSFDEPQFNVSTRDQVYVTLSACAPSFPSSRMATPSSLSLPPLSQQSIERSVERSSISRGSSIDRSSYYQNIHESALRSSTPRGLMSSSTGPASLLLYPPALPFSLTLPVTVEPLAPPEVSRGHSKSEAPARCLC